MEAGRQLAGGFGRSPPGLGDAAQHAAPFLDASLLYFFAFLQLLFGGQMDLPLQLSSQDRAAVAEGAASVAAEGVGGGWDVAGRMETTELDPSWFCAFASLLSEIIGRFILVILTVKGSMRIKKDHSVLHSFRCQR